MSKTKACRCCGGSGTELDNKATGAEMRAMRISKGMSLRQVGAKMKLCAPYICDLEKGHRNWTEPLVAKYRKAVQ
jgi:transcriptional regulator with XRE-family HTH domain